MKAKIISFIVYLITSVIFLMSEAGLCRNGVWGGVANPFHDLVPLLSIYGLVLGALICLINLAIGRIICGVIVILFGLFYVPGIISFFPKNIPDCLFPNSPLLLLFYYDVLAFALFYPTRLRFSVLIFAVVLAMDAFSTIVLLFGWN
jgi:hypothetical protein